MITNVNAVDTRNLIGGKTMGKVVILCWVVIPILVIACDIKLGDPIDNSMTRNKFTTELRVGGISTYRWKYDDGLECVLVYRGGVTCNWKGKP